MEREYGEYRCFQTVVSSGRPESVEAHTALFGPSTWVVPRRETDAYRRLGAPQVALGAGDNCARARNGALDIAFHVSANICLMLDDDPTGRSEYVPTPGTPAVMHLPIPEMMEKLLQRLQTSGLKLASTNHLTNANFVSKSMSHTATILGGCLAVRRGHLRFDEDLPVNSDIDFGLQHVFTWGGALRCNDLFLYFRRGNTKDGGVSAYRRRDLRIATVRRMEKKWPNWVSHKPDAPEHPVVKIPTRPRKVLD